jgi:hypothetical protein
MQYIIQNNYKRLINLGTEKGTMLFFLPLEAKELTQAEVDLFERQLERYVETGILSYQGKRQETVLDIAMPTKKKRVIAE